MDSLPGELIGVISGYLNLQDQDSLSEVCVKYHNYLAGELIAKPGDCCWIIVENYLRYT